MKFTHYGKDVIIKALTVTIIIDVIAIYVNILWIKLLLILISILFFAFTLYFFRDPDRKLPSNINDNSIISGADGKVVLIEEIENKKYDVFEKGEKLIQLSVFLSPLNVHVNRNPISGKVNFFEYIKGEYLVAFDHKASDKNERTEIGIINKNGKQIVFKQIAGFVARRIVCDLKLNDDVSVGEKFGMIKFGSRCDFIFKPDTKIFVKIGDKVKGGETIIAELC